MVRAISIPVNVCQAIRDYQVLVAPMVLAELARLTCVKRTRIVVKRKSAPSAGREYWTVLMLAGVYDVDPMQNVELADMRPAVSVGMALMVIRMICCVVVHLKTNAIQTMIV